MEEPVTNSTSPNEEKKNADCGCSDGSCKPKRKNVLSKVLFAVILLVALAIIGIKLAGRSDGGSGKQSIAAPGKAVCDTTKGKTCDTTKGSSCCSKK
jgi:hypothetical protein